VTNKSQSMPCSCNEYFSSDQLQCNLKTKALKGASITLLAQTCNYGIGTIGTIILARLLTPRDFGLVTMVLSISMLLQNFGANGFIDAIIQKKEIHHYQISTLFWINSAASLIIALLFMVSAPIIVWFFREPHLRSIVIAMSVTILLNGLSNQHQALLIRNMQFYRTSAYEVGAVFASLVVSISLAYQGFGYWALVAKWITSPLVITLGAWFMCRWRPGLPARGTGVKTMLKFALNTYANYVLNYFGKNIDKLLIGRYYGSQSVGNYDRAYQLSLLLPNQIVSPLAGVAISTFSRMAHDPERFRNRYLSVLTLLAFVGMPLSATMTLIGKDLIILVLGPQWHTAGHMFSIFGLSINVMMIYSTQAWIHLSLGTPERLFRWSIVALGVTVMCILVGLHFGTLGVAAGFSASFYILIGPSLWYAGRPIGLKVSSILETVWKFFVAAAIAGAGCWLILNKFDLVSKVFCQVCGVGKLLITTATCTIMYLFLIIVLHRGTYPIIQFISVLRDMAPQRFSNK
jgi:O-antigen/teichoic acid export membrane protein